MWLVVDDTWNENVIREFDAKEEAEAHYKAVKGASELRQASIKGDGYPYHRPDSIYLTEVKRKAFIKFDDKEETKYNESN